jgi:hypothetical protein
MLDPVKTYLRELPPLTRDLRIRLFTRIFDDLGNYADQIAELEPFSPGSNLFWYRLLLRGLNTFFSFNFVTDRSSAPFGVIRLVYAECHSFPLPE